MNNQARSRQERGGGFKKVCKYGTRGWEAAGATLLFVVPYEKMRGNEHKLKLKKFPLHLKKGIFTVSVVKYWDRLSREAWRYTSTALSHTL